MVKALAKSAGKKVLKRVIAGVLFSTFGIYLLLTIFIVLFISALIGASQNSPSPSPSQMLPVSVEVYRPEMTEVATQYDMLDYVDLLLAIMAQESCGFGTDPMQASECGYNTLYPRQPNGITDPHYSIECGVQQFRDAKNGATVQNAMDIAHIRIALQGYNFGLSYVTETMNGIGCWEQNNVYAFAQAHSGGKQRDPNSSMYREAGPWAYGDQHYPDHVLKFYNSGGDIGDEEFQRLKDVIETQCIGKPYVFGASGPNMFDCSGFVCYAFSKSRVRRIGRTTAQGLHDMCNEISPNELKPGDLVFFTRTYDTPHPVSHVGIYMGYNQFTEANSSKGVCYSPLDSAWVNAHIYSYGRLPGM